MTTKLLNFQPWQVRAFDEGRLTRVTFPMNIEKCFYAVPAYVDGPVEFRPCCHSWPGKCVDGSCKECRDEVLRKNPLGLSGDKIWIREKFHHQENFHGKSFTWYAADDTISKGWDWSPAITMPQKFSRHTAEIVGVKVLRIQDLTEEAAEAHGYDPVPDGGIPEEDEDGNVGLSEEIYPGYPALQFLEDDWNSRHAKKGLGWEKNPWCFSYEIKRI